MEKDKEKYKREKLKNVEKKNVKIIDNLMYKHYSYRSISIIKFIFKKFLHT